MQLIGERRLTGRRAASPSRILFVRSRIDSSTLNMVPLRPTLKHKGLDAEALNKVYISRVDDRGFIREVIAEIQSGDAETRCRACWLLLRHSAERSDIPESFLCAAIRVATNAPTLETRLHLCQLFSRIDCPAAVIHSLFEFLSDCAANKRAFLRVWAFTALWRLGKNSAPYRREVDAWLLVAQTDPSDTVRRRLRQEQVSSWGAERRIAESSCQRSTVKKSAAEIK
jgi:hypothetical protein